MLENKPLSNERIIAYHNAAKDFPTVIIKDGKPALQPLKLNYKIGRLQDALETAVTRLQSVKDEKAKNIFGVKADGTLNEIKYTDQAFVQYNEELDELMNVVNGDVNMLSAHIKLEEFDNIDDLRVIKETFIDLLELVETETDKKSERYISLRKAEITIEVMNKITNSILRSFSTTTNDEQKTIGIPFKLARKFAAQFSEFKVEQDKFNKWQKETQRSIMGVDKKGITRVMLRNTAQHEQYERMLKDKLQEKVETKLIALISLDEFGSTARVESGVLAGLSSLIKD